MPAYADFNDADHVRRTLRGDKTAFDALVRQYHPMVFTIALARLDYDYDMADELTQEVFLRAWLHLGRLSKPDYFPAWLVQITRNLAVDWKRRDRRRSALVQLIAAEHPDALAIPADAPSPREAVAAHSEARELNRCLQRLSHDQRELLLLHYGEGISQSEIARGFGVSPSTVMRRLDAALQRLRKMYNQNAAEQLAARRESHQGAARRTLATMAIAWSISSVQRSALAQSAEQVFATPAMPASKTLAGAGAKFVAGAASAAIIAAVSLAIWSSSNATGNGASVSEATSAQKHSRRVTQIRAMTEQRARLDHSTMPPVQSAAVPADPGTTLAASIRRSASHSTASVSVASPSTTPTLAQKFRDPQIAKQHPQPGMVTGQVLDPQGRPVPDLTVHFSAVTESIPSTKSEKVRAAHSLNQMVYQSGRTDTDANGNFVLNFRTTGTAALATDHMAYARTFQVVDLPTSGVIIQLSNEGATVEGMVRDLATGDPVPYADVMLVPQMKVDYWMGDRQGTQSITLMSGYYTKLQADSTGHYFDSRMPATYVSAQAAKDNLIPVRSSYIKVEMDPILEPGKTTRLADIYVYPGYTLRGYVREEGTSRPLAGVSVGPATSMGAMVGKRPERVITDANGYYEVARLQPISSGSGSDGESPRLMFEYITAELDGYKSKGFMPRVDGMFNPDELTIERDIELTPGEDSGPERNSGPRIDVHRL